MKSLPNMKTGPEKTQRGATLIEVLITALLLAIGLITTLGMQVKSKEGLYDATQRTIAANLAFDISERIRSNRLARDSYYGVYGGSQMAQQVCTSVATCTPAGLAAFDLYDWELMLDGASEQSGGNAAGGLVNPQACITGPAGGGQGAYTVSIVWRGVKPLSNPQNDACGEGSGLYGAANEYRRLVSFTLFMS